MKNLADFMSSECRIKFGASLHWCRSECRLDIANAAARISCLPEEIDALETGRKKANLVLAARLLDLYGKKITLNVEGYDD